jgi:hypothetical protein
MGTPWHIFTVPLRGSAGVVLLALRCVVCAGAIAASKVTLVARKREATDSFMVATSDCWFKVWRYYSREPAFSLEAFCGEREEGPKADGRGRQQDTRAVSGGSDKAIVRDLAG